MRAMFFLAAMLAACGGQPPAVTTKAKAAIEISPRTVVLQAGDKMQFQVADGTPVEWHLSQPDAGTIDSTGLFVAGTEEGDYSVTAFSIADATVNASSSITVQDDMRDFGGDLLPAPRVISLWWGPRGAFAAEDEALVDAYLRGLNGTPYLAVVNQYLRGETAQVTPVAALHDEVNPPPETTPNQFDFAAEVCSQAQAAGVALQAFDVFAVFSSVYPRDAQYGAFHNSTSCNGSPMMILFMPMSPGVAGAPPRHSSCDPYGWEASTFMNQLAHELGETMTDPFPFLGGWRDAGGEELFDKCETLPPYCVPIGGRMMQVAGRYSNATHGCVGDGAESHL